MKTQIKILVWIAGLFWIGGFLVLWFVDWRIPVGSLLLFIAYGTESEAKKMRKYLVATSVKPQQ